MTKEKCELHPPSTSGLNYSSRHSALSNCYRLHPFSSNFLTSPLPTPRSFVPQMKSVERERKRDHWVLTDREVQRCSRTGEKFKGGEAAVPSISSPSEDIPENSSPSSPLQKRKAADAIRKSCNPSANQLKNPSSP
uniref:Uncharacterized protein n=1 Tax=Micrurus lemniscatus lemniscatus TaxID=129467 RepID=A0A2D4IGJ5_MICLE